MRIFLLQERFDEQFKDFTNMELEFMLSALPLKVNTEKASENLQMELMCSVIPTLITNSRINHALPTYKTKGKAVGFRQIMTDAVTTVNSVRSRSTVQGVP